MPLLEDFPTTGHLVITSPFNEDLKEIAAMCHELTAELDIIARDRSDYGGVSEDCYHGTLPEIMRLIQRIGRRAALCARDLSQSYISSEEVLNSGGVLARITTSHARAMLELAAVRSVFDHIEHYRRGISDHLRVHEREFEIFHTALIEKMGQPEPELETRWHGVESALSYAVRAYTSGSL